MKVVFSILFGSILFAGCMPKPSDGDLLRNLVVYTDYDTNNDFTQHSTFYLGLDSINYYNSNDPNPQDTLQTSAYSGDFIDYLTRTISDSLVRRGYQSVSKKSSPDLKVYIYVIENYSVSYSYYPYNYGYGYGYYGYGYGYGGGYSASVSDVADLYIQILDLKHPVNGKPKLIWYCDIGDLISLSSNEAFYRALVQAFKQSKYLRK